MHVSRAFLTGGIVWMLKNVRYITVARATVPCMSLKMAGKNFKISWNCLIIAWE